MRVCVTATSTGMHVASRRGTLRVRYAFHHAACHGKLTAVHKTLNVVLPSSQPPWGPKGCLM